MQYNDSLLTCQSTSADINAKQIEHLCRYYGQSLEDDLLGNIEVNAYEEVLPEVSEKPHYVSVDGSMYYTREEDLEGNQTGSYLQTRRFNGSF